MTEEVERVEGGVEEVAVIEEVEGNWVVQGGKSLVERIHYFYDGTVVINPDIFKPTFGASPDFKIGYEEAFSVVRPYQLELLKREVNIEHANGTTTGLVVGLKHYHTLNWEGRQTLERLPDVFGGGFKVIYHTDISLVQFEWTHKTRMDQRKESFHFIDGQPAKYSDGYTTKPHWPLSHPPILDYRDRQFIEELGKERPELEKPLSSIIRKLSTDTMVQGHINPVYRLERQT